MSDEVSFRPGLFRGTAAYYDRFRLSYPEVLVADLMRRAGPSGRGRLLDLACGTGQLAFALRPVVSRAEELDAPAGHFELVVIGNAFHRLPRDLVARLAHGWLAPGGFLALCWSFGTQAGSLDWQVALGDLIRHWIAVLGCGDRVPANWDLARKERPDADVLSGPGSSRPGTSRFPSSTTGRCRSSPGWRARCQSFRPPR